MYLCHLLVLSPPTLMVHGHTNLKHDIILEKKLANVITENKEDRIYTEQAIYL